MHCYILLHCLFLSPPRAGCFPGEFSVETKHPRSSPWKTGQIWLNEVCKLHLTITVNWETTWRAHDSMIGCTWFHSWPSLLSLVFSCRPLVLTVGWQSRCPHLNSLKYKYLKNDHHKPSSWYFISWSYRSASQNLHLQMLQPNTKRIPYRLPHGVMPTSRVQLPSKTGHDKLPADKKIRSSCASANSNHPIPDDQSTRFAKSLKHFNPNVFSLSPHTSKWNCGSWLMYFSLFKTVLKLNDIFLGPHSPPTKLL